MNTPKINVASILNKCKSFNNSKGNGNDFTKVAYLPEGTHKGRFIIDPTGEAFIQFQHYGNNSKGLRDPKSVPANELPDGFKDEIADYASKLYDLDRWNFGLKSSFLTYFYLEETDSPSDYWKPNNLYVLVAKNKFAKAFTNFLTVTSEDENTILTMFDPTKETPRIVISFTSGQSGSCNLSVNYPFKQSAPIDISKHNYVPLEDAWIPRGFNIETYNAYLELIRNEYEQTIAKKNSSNSESENESSKPEETKSNSQQSINEIDQKMVSDTQEDIPSTENKPQTVSPSNSESTQTANQNTSTSNTANQSSDNPWDKYKNNAVGD